MARRSFSDIPPDCALDTWTGLVETLAEVEAEVEVEVVGSPALDGLETFRGKSGLAKFTVFLGASTTGARGGRGFNGVVSNIGLAGNLSFVGGLSVTRGDLTGGPPDLITLGTLAGTLTAGSGGALSITGVLGM